LELNDKANTQAKETTDILNAVNSIIKAIPIEKEVITLVKEILSRLNKLMNIGSDEVSLSCIQILNTIVERNVFIKHAELTGWGYYLVQMFGENKMLNNAYTNALRSISMAVGAISLLELFIPDLKSQPDHRTYTAIAILSESWASTVIPILIYEYKLADSSTIKNCLLQAFSCIFEYIREIPKDCINLILPLIRDGIRNEEKMKGTLFLVFKYADKIYPNFY
jgi:hypothetical protein